MTPTADRQDVDRFEAFPVLSYADIDLGGLAAFAIQRLQDLRIPTTFENIVVALFRLFPEKFSLEGFAIYPDAARVGRTLLQLGPKYRNWARGSVRTGFVLTEAGQRKAAAVGSTLVAKPARPSGAQRSTAPRTMDLSKDIVALEQSALFHRWKSAALHEGEPRELFDLLGAYAYSPARALRSRVQLLENAARQVGREDVLAFLRAVQEVFGVYL